jgi:putative flippase GtrA
MLQALFRAATTRFVAVGLAMTVLHLVVFRLLLPWSVPEVANVVAFLVATQVNFVLSYYWTWSARRPLGRETVGSVARRAVLFNGSAALGFGVNAAGFSTALRVVGLTPLLSAVAATVASAAATFLLSSRVVFARRRIVLDAVDAAGPITDGADPTRTPGAAPAAGRATDHSITHPSPPPLEGVRR